MGDSNDGLLIKTNIPIGKIFVFLVVCIFIVAILNHVSQKSKIDIIIVGIFGMPVFIAYLYTLHSIAIYFLYEDCIVVKTPFRLLKKTMKIYLRDIDYIIYYFNNHVSDQLRFVMKDGSMKHTNYNRTLIFDDKFSDVMALLKSKGISINRRTIFHRYTEFKESEW